MTEYIIEVDGSISNVRVISGLCQEIKDELIKIVAEMPPHEPAIRNGKKVSSTQILMVIF